MTATVYYRVNFLAAACFKKHAAARKSARRLSLIYKLKRVWLVFNYFTVTLRAAVAEQAPFKPLFFKVG